MTELQVGQENAVLNKRTASILAYILICLVIGSAWGYITPGNILEGISAFHLSMFVFTCLFATFVTYNILLNFRKTIRFAVPLILGGIVAVIGFGVYMGIIATCHSLLGVNNCAQYGLDKELLGKRYSLLIFLVIGFVVSLPLQPFFYVLRLLAEGNSLDESIKSLRALIDDHSKQNVRKDDS